MAQAQQGGYAGGRRPAGSPPVSRLFTQPAAKQRIAEHRDKMARLPVFEVRIDGGHDALIEALNASGRDYTVTTHQPRGW